MLLRGRDDEGAGLDGERRDEGVEAVGRRLVSAIRDAPSGSPMKSASAVLVAMSSALYES